MAGVAVKKVELVNVKVSKDKEVNKDLLDVRSLCPNDVNGTTDRGGSINSARRMAGGIQRKEEDESTRRKNTITIVDDPLR